MIYLVMPEARTHSPSGWCVDHVTILCVLKNRAWCHGQELPSLSPDIVCFPTYLGYEDNFDVFVVLEEIVGDIEPGPRAAKDNRRRRHDWL